jgi:hypothetical protein
VVFLGILIRRFPRAAVFSACLCELAMLTPWMFEASDGILWVVVWGNRIAHIRKMRNIGCRPTRMGILKRLSRSP